MLAGLVLPEASLLGLELVRILVVFSHRLPSATAHVSLPLHIKTPVTLA